MSYARKDVTSSRVFDNAVRSIVESRKYKGYSILAGEYLLDSVRAAKMPEKPTNKRFLNYAEALEQKYPADFWRMSKMYPNWDVEQQRKASYVLRFLPKRKKSFYLTFEGRKFQVSSLHLAVDYLRACICREAWNNLPNQTTAHAMLKKDGRCVFRYGENKAIIERAHNG